MEAGMRTRLGLLGGMLVLVTVCGRPEEGDELPRAQVPDTAMLGGPASPFGGEEARGDPERLERERHDPAWRRYAERDLASRSEGRPRVGTRGTAPAGPPSPGSTSTPLERWEDIRPEAVTPGRVRLPVEAEAEGPSVLAVQVLLDRTGFSPGVLDGRWGKNTEKAVFWFQHSRGLEPTGSVDQATLDRLLRAAASGEGTLVVERRLGPRDVEGPFRRLPDDVYARAELECLCYESLAEKLAERFHTTVAVLERLNPGVDLDGLGEGDPLTAPAVGSWMRGSREEPAVARLVVSGGGHYLHALDRAGRILYHFPSTLGSRYEPSPSGELRVTAVAFEPEWHYQPELLEGEPDDAPDAVLPPGPNSAVGSVWIALSEPHYGIHGTHAPETIGYATSSGCVRLTNWDARFLAERVGLGVPVEFRDTEG